MTFIISSYEEDAPEIHTGDFGTVFIATILNQDEQVVNLSTATSIKFKFYKPTRVSVEKTASLYTNGQDGKMSYIAEDGLFDMDGLWKYCAVVSFAAGSWTSNVLEFRVYPVIPDEVVV